MSPTKPIKPVNEITIDVIKADRTRIFLRVEIGSPPVEIAKSSPPSESVFKSHAHFIADGMMQIIAADTQITSGRLGLDRLP